MDEDTDIFLKKNAGKVKDKEVLLMVELLAKAGAPISKLVKDAYNIDEEFGDTIFAGILASTLLNASNNSDQALTRLSKVFTISREEIVKLDAAVIKGGR